jgi:RNA polymerase sigma-70 factor, ECF subfamily
VAAIYRRALPHVYGYLLPRCGSVSLAEDLTAETFTAAVAATREPDGPELTETWLVGAARHKLVDHWRRSEREQRTAALATQPDDALDDPWDEWLDTDAAYAALRHLNAHRSPTSPPRSRRCGRRVSASGPTSAPASPSGKRSSKTHRET